MNVANKRCNVFKTFFVKVLFCFEKYIYGSVHFYKAVTDVAILAQRRSLNDLENILLDDAIKQESDDEMV